MKFLNRLFFTVFTLFSVQSFASNVASFSYASTNVTTGAYVTLVASTPINVSHIYVCDNSGQILKIATGASGHEVDLVAVPLSACMLIPLSPTLPAGTRLSIEAISGTANSGYNVVSFLL